MQNWTWPEAPKTVIVDADPKTWWHLLSLMSFPDKERQKAHAIFKTVKEIRSVSNLLEEYQEAKAKPKQAPPAIRARGPHDIEEKNFRGPADKLPSEILKIFNGPGIVALINNFPETGFENKLATGMTNGILVGCCLMFFHLLETGDYRTATGRRADVSMNVVAYICENYNLGREGRSRGRPTIENKVAYPTIDKKLVRAVWKDYAHMAHIWAAYLHCRNSLTVPQEEDFWLDIDRQEFILLVEQYEQVVSRLLIKMKANGTLKADVAPVNLLHIERFGGSATIDSKPAEIVAAFKKYVSSYRSGPSISTSQKAPQL